MHFATPELSWHSSARYAAAAAAAAAGLVAKQRLQRITASSFASHYIMPLSSTVLCRVVSAVLINEHDSICVRMS